MSKSVILLLLLVSVQSLLPRQKAPEFSAISVIYKYL